MRQHGSSTWCQALETEVWAKHQWPQMHHRWFGMAKGNFKYKITDRGSVETSPSKERVQQIWMKSLLFIQCFFSKICLNSRNQDHRSLLPPISKTISKLSILWCYILQLRVNFLQTSKWIRRNNLYFTLMQLYISQYDIQCPNLFVTMQRSYFKLYFTISCTIFYTEVETSVQDPL